MSSGSAAALVAAAHLFWSSRTSGDDNDRSPAVPLLGGIVSGAAIGLLSGLTGTGRGIFLSPLLLFMGWTGTRLASGVSAAFILANLIAVLTGTWLGTASSAVRACAVPWRSSW